MMFQIICFPCQEIRKGEKETEHYMNYMTLPDTYGTC